MAEGYISGPSRVNDAINQDFQFESWKSHGYTHIALGSNVYPSGSVTITGGKWYYNNGYTNSNYSFRIGLCDYTGDIYSQIGTLTIKGQNTQLAGSDITIKGTIDNQNLAGKDLYLYVSGSGASDLVFSGWMTITVSTANKWTASTFSASDIYFGDTSSVNISNTYISSLKHDVTWTVGSHSHTESVGIGTRSASYQIPESWMDTIPSNTSANLVISVKTKDSSNTQVGSVQSKTYTVSVPASIVPGIESVTADVYQPVTGFDGIYIRGLTGATVTLNNATANGYASIASYSLSSVPEETATQSSNVFTITELENSGDIVFTATVTDSRGRTSEPKTVTINVKSYYAPAISSVEVYRCNADRIADDNGTYANLSCFATYSNIEGNSLTINSKYYASAAPGTKYTAKNNMISGDNYLIGDGNLDTSTSYYVECTATDTLGGTVTTTTLIQTAMYSIHIQNGGQGVAFGKVSEINKAVEINYDWDLYYRGRPIEQYIEAEVAQIPEQIIHLIDMMENGLILDGQNADWVSSQG